MVLAVLGLVLGVLLALTAHDERTTVRIDEEDVAVTLGNKTIGSVPRAQLSSALQEHGELVLIARCTDRTGWSIG